MSKTQQQEKEKAKSSVDLWPRWALEKNCFKDAKIRDMKTGKDVQWPYLSSDPVAEIGWSQFLEKITDPDTGFFYPKRHQDGDDEGKIIPTTKDNIPAYKVRVIIRMRKSDGSEYLLSKGNFIGHGPFGQEISKYVSLPERWYKQNFTYERSWDEKRKTITKICTGQGDRTEVYTMPFSQENCKKLFDRRLNDSIQFIVKEEQTGTPRQVTGVNINEIYQLFSTKPFEYLFDAKYLSPELKAQYRQEAIDQGLLSAPGTAPGTTATISTPPKEGTYL